jgi:hypothetical protein
MGGAHRGRRASGLRLMAAASTRPWRYSLSLRLNMISVSLLRVHGNPDPVDESCACIASVRVTSASETY